jgi:hypothetical protein
VIRLAIAGLLSVAGGLTALLTWELGVFSATGPVIALRPSQAAATQPVAAADHSTEWTATILARPLLSPDRRPPAETEANAGNGMSNGLPRLSGVVVGPFGRSAIFAADGDKPVVALEGGRVGAWTVRSIAGGTVEVTGPGGARTLHPSFQSSPAGAPPSAQRVGLSLAR